MDDDLRRWLRPRWPGIFLAPTITYTFGGTTLDAAIAVAATLAVIWAVEFVAWRSTQIRRTVLCLGGRLCPRVAITEYETDAPDLFAGALIHVDYSCDRCDTRYRSEAMLLDDGTWTEPVRARLPVS